MARNVLVKYTGDAEEAKAAADEVIDKLKEIPKETQTEIRVNAEEAKREADEVIARIKLLPKEEQIVIRIDADLTKLDRLEAKLATLKAEAASMDPASFAAGTQSKKIAAATQNVDRTVSHLRGLRAELETVDQSITGFATRAVSDFAKAGRSVDDWTKGIGKARQGVVSFTSSVLGHVPLIGGIFAKLAESIGGLATQLLPEAATGVGAFIGQAAGLVFIGPAMLAIASACAALVVALGMALIAVVALGAAFLVALGPIAIVLGLVLSKIKDIVSAQQSLKTAALNVKSALESQKQSLLSLTQAEQAAGIQRQAALEDEKTKVLALTDAQNGQKDAALAVQSAILGAQQARLTLASMQQQLAGFGTSPGDLAKKAQGVNLGGQQGQTQTGADPLGYEQLLLNYKEAVLAVKTADQGVKDATGAAADAANTLADAYKAVNQYMRMGLKAYPAYLAATNAEKAAQLAYAHAVTQTAAAHLAQRQALLHGQDQAVSFMAVWTKLKRTMGLIFGPAEKAVFAGIEQALLILSGHGKGLTGAFKNLGTAIGAAFVGFAKWMTAPGTMKSLKTIINDAASLTRKWAPGLFALLTILLKVAVNLLPSIIAWVAKMSKKFEDAAKHPEKIKHFLDECLHDLHLFLTVIGKIIGVVTTLAGLFKSMKGVLIALVGIFAASKLAKFVMGGVNLAKGAGGLLKRVLGGGAGEGAAADAGEVGTLGIADVAAPVVATAAVGAVAGTLARKYIPGVASASDWAVHGALGLLGAGPGPDTAADNWSGYDNNTVAPATYAAWVQALRTGLWTNTRTGLVTKLTAAARKNLVELVQNSRPANQAQFHKVDSQGNVLPTHAAGGIATAASLGIFGEGGSEALIPLAGAGAQMVARALTRTMVPELGQWIKSSLPSATMAGALSPATAGGIHHHNWHLNQGDTIASDEHFATVIERRLAGLGQGWKG